MARSTGRVDTPTCPNCRSQMQREDDCGEIRYFCVPCQCATCIRCNIIQSQRDLDTKGMCALCVRELLGYRLRRKMDLEQLILLLDVGPSARYDYPRLPFRSERTDNKQRVKA